jgi:hypothetical protein
LSEDQKSKVLNGYIIYAMIVGLFTFLIQIVIFSDFEIPLWSRFIIALGLSLIFTKSPLYPTIAKKNGERYLQ